MNRRDFLKTLGALSLLGLSSRCCMTLTGCKNADPIGEFSIDGKDLVTKPYQIGLSSGYNLENAVLAYITGGRRSWEKNRLKFDKHVRTRRLRRRIGAGFDLNLVHFTNLEPGHDYGYEITGTPVKGTVKTAHRHNEPFSFFTVGDTQNELNSLRYNLAKKTLATLMLKNDSAARLLVNCGDVTEHSRMKEYYCNFFPSYSSLLAEMPLYVVKGNHDYKELQLFDDIFGYGIGVPGLPVKDKIAVNYSFDYGNVHFVVLDSMHHLGRAKRFLKKDLKKSKARFNLVFMHHPFRVDTEGLPVHGVFAGHLHTYRRFRHKRTKAPYVITGGGGAYMYKIDRFHWIYNGKNLEELGMVHIHHYLHFNFEKDRIDVNMVDIHGQVRDRFRIKG